MGKQLLNHGSVGISIYKSKHLPNAPFNLVKFDSLFGQSLLEMKHECVVVTGIIECDPTNLQVQSIKL